MVWSSKQWWKVEEAEWGIQKQVKKCLHLEPFINDCLCCASYVDGRLGLIKPAAHIYTIQLEIIENVLIWRWLYKCCHLLSTSAGPDPEEWCHQGSQIIILWSYPEVKEVKVSGFLNGVRAKWQKKHKYVLEKPGLNKIKKLSVVMPFTNSYCYCNEMNK